MALLAIVFTGLYVSALTGLLRPVADLTMLARLEPILFLIFGYYFGRIPAKKNEDRIMENCERLEQKLEVANRIKEQAHAEREAIEEKIRNVRVALRPELLNMKITKRTMRDDTADNGHYYPDPSPVETAINILNS